MASFTPPTYDQPVPNLSAKRNQDIRQEIGHFPVSKIVFICEDDEAHETTSLLGNFSKHECLAHKQGIKTGTGDNGLALFRRGKTYTVSAGEETILTNAGYTVT